MHVHWAQTTKNTRHTKAIMLWRMRYFFFFFLSLPLGYDLSKEKSQYPPTRERGWVSQKNHKVNVFCPYFCTLLLLWSIKWERAGFYPVLSSAVEPLLAGGGGEGEEGPFVRFSSEFSEFARDAIPDFFSSFSSSSFLHISSRSFSSFFSL